MAVSSAGVVTGFLVGCSPDISTFDVDGEGDFGKGYWVGYGVGVTAWVLCQVARLVGHFAKN